MLIDVYVLSYLKDSSCMHSLYQLNKKFLELLSQISQCIFKPSANVQSRLKRLTLIKICLIEVHIGQNDIAKIF